MAEPTVEHHLSVHLVTSDREKLTRYRQRLNESPPSEGTDAGLGLANFCDGVIGEKEALIAILNACEKENAQMKEIRGLRSAASATDEEMAVIRFLVKRVTLTQESTNAMTQLREDLALKPSEELREVKAAKAVAEHAKARVKQLKTALNRLAGEREARSKVVMRAIEWAAQGARSRWSTEPSLALWDAVQALKEDRDDED